MFLVYENFIQCILDIFIASIPPIAIPFPLPFLSSQLWDSFSFSIQFSFPAGLGMRSALGWGWPPRSHTERKLTPLPAAFTAVKAPQLVAGFDAHFLLLPLWFLSAWCLHRSCTRCHNGSEFTCTASCCVWRTLSFVLQLLLTVTAFPL